MNEKEHWLARSSTIRWLWRVFALMLAAVVLWQLWTPVHGHFGIDGLFGFHAAYGFLTCVGMVLFAKLLGVFLKRPEDYYDRDV